MSWEVHPRRPRSPLRFDVLRIGTTVRVKGLRSAEQHNGRTGTVSRFDARATGGGRYTVALRPGNGQPSQTLALKRGNVDQIVRGVTICDLASRPELNGSKATIFKFNAAKGRYLVELEGVAKKEQLSLKPERVLLPTGTVVTIVGLTSADGSKYNGKGGTIVSTPRSGSSGRYGVKLCEAKQLQLRVLNLVI